MITYAKVTIAKFDGAEFVEHDLPDYIAKFGQPADHATVRLYIVDEIPYHDEPKVNVMGWLAGRYYYSQVARLHGQPAQSQGHGNYTIAVVRVRIEGDAKAAYQEVRDVPRPKSRCPVQWIDGRWMKYLKAQGWVVA